MIGQRGVAMSAFMMTLLTPGLSSAQRNAAVDAPFVLEHSYWIAPGMTGRFVELFNRNKLPLLKREMAEGRILWMRMTEPRLRSGDAAQADLRLTIAWRNAAVAWDDVDPSRFVPALYKDAAARSREEDERERLVLRRSDVPVQERLLGRD